VKQSSSTLQYRTFGKLAACVFSLGAVIAGPVGKEMLAAPRGCRVSLRAEGVEKTVARPLTFGERVAHQRAIEEVFWRHRSWPKDNPEPKPPLEALVSHAQLETKVRDYLRTSQLVVEQRGSPIGAGELQTEMDRMARQTKQPAVLRELFAALGNDPFVIAECLARPFVAERLGGEPSLTPVSWHRPVPGVVYRVPKIEDANGCTNDTWTPTSTVNAPEGQFVDTVVWTGSEMIMWGGGRPPYNTGGRYNPSTDTWTATPIINAPAGRGGHSLVWTGSEMIVWGGNGGAGEFNTGGRYNPMTNAWTATSTLNAPFGQSHHSAVWTGSEMIVWGGIRCAGNCWVNTGGRYNLRTDSWTPTSTIDAPDARWNCGSACLPN
jgi:hypothetical protein